jgi:hypothetical protein
LGNRLAACEQHERRNQQMDETHIFPLIGQSQPASFEERLRSNLPLCNRSRKWTALRQRLPTMGRRD